MSIVTTRSGMKVMQSKYGYHWTIIFYGQNWKVKEIYTYIQAIADSLIDSIMDVNQIEVSNIVVNVSTTPKEIMNSNFDQELVFDGEQGKFNVWVADIGSA